MSRMMTTGFRAGSAIRGLSRRLGAPHTRGAHCEAMASSTSAPVPLVVLNPFDVSRPYAIVLTIALGMALLPGLGTGLLLILIAGLHLPLAVPWPQLAQAHGQIQAIGFTLLFTVA